MLPVSNIVVGVDFGAPRRARDQRRKIVATAAQPVADRRYRFDAIGMNERLLAKDPPGWSAKELLGELLTRTVRIVAFDGDPPCRRNVPDGNQCRCDREGERRRHLGAEDLAGHVAAEANHCSEPRVRRVLDAVYDRLASIEHTFTDEEGAAETVVHESKPFTAKQGQYLAYICYYTKIHGRPPAESDLQRFFRVTPPVVHQMIKTLDARGLIERQPGVARSIRLRLTRAQLPDLE